mmetsp:Transcript_25976/g.85505  ORF Transcript_25976/g.85505 Transcript_25976/m.85505 type:complete len:516 (-) Transcript_25976:266-1813(-)
MSHRLQDFSLCAIPLKQVDEPPKEEQVQKMKSLLINEFAVKYLQSIGVTPSESNIRRVKSEIPLNHLKLKAAYKSKGGLEDMMYIEKTNPKLRGRHLWRPYAAKSLFSEILDKKLGQTYAEVQVNQDAKAVKSIVWPDQEREAAKTKESALPHLSMQKVASATRPPPLSPIKRDDIATRIAVAKELGKPPESARSVSGRRSHQHVKLYSQSSTSSAEAHGLQVTMDDILSLQTMFVHTFPLSHIQERLSSQDMALLVTELTGLEIAQLILDVCEFCEWAILFKGSKGDEANEIKVDDRPRSPPQKQDKDIENLLLKIFGGWMEIQSHMMKRAQKLVAFPIYLMLIRVVLETVFRNAASFLFVNPMEEVNVLDMIDEIIEKLLDPDGYLNYPLPAPPGRSFIDSLRPQRSSNSLPAFESLRTRPWAPVGFGVMKKGHASSKFNTVSPAVKSLLLVADSPALRRMRNQAPEENKGEGESPAKSLIGQILSTQSLNKLYLLALKKHQKAEETKKKLRC